MRSVFGLLQLGKSAAFGIGFSGQNLKFEQSKNPASDLALLDGGTLFDAQ
jgi:hypothetical protein